MHEGQKLTWKDEETHAEARRRREKITFSETGEAYSRSLPSRAVLLVSICVNGVGNLRQKASFFRETDRIVCSTLASDFFSGNKLRDIDDL